MTTRDGRRKMRVILLLCSLLVAGCSDDWKKSDQELEQCGSIKCKEVLFHRNLDGQHKLRKLMPERETVDPYLRGSFLLLLGNVSAGANRNITVTFSWQMNDKAYAITTVDLNRVRVHLDDSVEEPWVYFRWQFDSWSDSLTAKVYSDSITEATIMCRPEDWPKSIQLPLTKERKP